MSFALRQTVIHRGEKWLILARPSETAFHGLYTLAKPDRSGRISKESVVLPNVHAVELQAEVDLCA